MSELQEREDISLTLRITTLFDAQPIPDPTVLFYQRTLPNGRREIATIHTLTVDLQTKAWRALFRVPGLPDFHMDQYTSELRNWEPVFAVTQSDIADLVERSAQRAVEIMQDNGASHADAVATAMELVTEDAFTCNCGKNYKYEKSFTKHRKNCSE